MIFEKHGIVLNEFQVFEEQIQRWTEGIFSKIHNWNQFRKYTFSLSNTKYYCTGMPTTIQNALFCVYTLSGIGELTVVVDEELVAEELSIEARHVLERPAAVHGQQHLVRHKTLKNKVIFLSVFDKTQKSSFKAHDLWFSKNME